MNKRKIIIGLLLVIPAVALIALAQKSMKAPEVENVKRGSISVAPVVLPSTDPALINNPPKGPPHTLEEAKQRVRARMAVLDKMTPQEWGAEQSQRAMLKQKQLLEMQQEDEKAKSAKPFPDLGAMPSDTDGK